MFFHIKQFDHSLKYFSNMVLTVKQRYDSTELGPVNSVYMCFRIEAAWAKRMAQISNSNAQLIDNTMQYCANIQTSWQIGIIQSLNVEGIQVPMVCTYITFLNGDNDVKIIFRGGTGDSRWQQSGLKHSRDTPLKHHDISIHVRV